MRLRILSDIHLEFGDYVPPVVEADVVVLAGDVGKGTAVIPWAARHFPETPCVFVPGNHEYYGGSFEAVLAALRAAAVGTHVRVLDRDAVEIGGVRFVGATLWTDYALGGDRVKNLAAAAYGLADYRHIRLEPSYRKLRPEDTWGWHDTTLGWMRSTLAASTGPTVVVTHHAPSPRSLADRYVGDPLSAAFISDLDSFVAESGAKLWIHGHTHHSVDYMLGATRVLSNQRGYPTETDCGFQPTLVVEV